MTWEWLELALPSAGLVATEIPIPRDLALVGQVLYQQMLALEFAPGIGLSGVASTNGIAALVGAF